MDIDSICFYYMIYEWDTEMPNLTISFQHTTKVLVREI